MKVLVALLLLGALSCSTTDSKQSSSPVALAIVDKIAAANAEVARLTIHATPQGESQMRIVASTVPGRIGDASDPEDLQAAKTGKPIELREGRNLDYTYPVQDESGRATAVVGVTISGATGASDETLRGKARDIAAETAAAIRGAKQPLW